MKITVSNRASFGRVTIKDIVRHCNQLLSSQVGDDPQFFTTEGLTSFSFMPNSNRVYHGKMIGIIQLWCSSNKASDVDYVSYGGSGGSAGKVHICRESIPKLYDVLKNISDLNALNISIEP